MTRIPEHKCGSVGMKMGVLFALIGAAMPVGMMLKEFLQSVPGFTTGALHPDDLTKWPILIGVIITLITLSVVGAILGRTAGHVICRRRSSRAGAALVGICLAISCLVAAVLVAALFSVVVQPSLDSAGVSGLFALMTVIVGALPATALGVLYGMVVRWRIAKVEGWQQSVLA